MPPFSPALLLALVVAALVGLFLLRLIEPIYAEGQLRIRLFRRQRPVASFALRDTWMLLLLSIVMGWAVAAAVERAAWVTNSDGRLVPAMSLAVVFGWVLGVGRLPRLFSLLASALALLAALVLLSPTPLTGGGVPSIASLQKWLLDLPSESGLALLIGLILLMLLSGLWTSWWVFRRRNGLVALLPTGSILAVEIINDSNALLYFFSIVWVAAAACILLRLNFVALKERWRARRLPRASDTGWTFGEVGVEAVGALLLASFLLIPPLTSTDISGFLVPGTLSADPLHPFGLGAGGHAVVGSIGYSETVRPGSQLKAKSQTVMIVSGDTSTYYPYWRGIALAGWDGISWYQLPSTPGLPVRERPRIAARQAVPRDDLPADPGRLETLRDSFRVLVPLDQTANSVFSAGEVVTVEDQPTTARGISTSNTSAGGILFDTVDRIRFIGNLHPPYTYTVTQATPKVDVTTLRQAGVQYPGWLLPYQNLYEGGRIASGYATTRDSEIRALAQEIVRAAGATNPYDQAKAIESWFLSKGRFTYTLTPPASPAGVRPLDYFLFSSKKGFCQDFSTAMNVMLRLLGVPSRQMSGFGQGVLDEKTHRILVNSLDAHSWVEVYFPGYGWIPFEPTPDQINFPVNRPNTAAELNSPAVTNVVPSTRPRANFADTPLPQGAGAAGTFSRVTEPLLIAGAVALLLLLLATAGAVRWLFMVSDMPRIWRRLQFLADRLQVPRHRGDTPEEFGRRLAGSVPDLDRELRSLARLYTRNSFRRGGLDPAEGAEARESWSRIRQSYPGLVARAWRDALLRGQVIRARGGEPSKSPKR